MKQKKSRKKQPKKWLRVIRVVDRQPAQPIATPPPNPLKSLASDIKCRIDNMNKEELMLANIACALIKDVVGLVTRDNRAIERARFLQDVRCLFN